MFDVVAVTVGVAVTVSVGLVVDAAVAGGRGRC